MAKKKQKKNWRYHLTQPLSTKSMALVIVILATVAAVNTHVFRSFPARVETVPSVVTQTDLMSVLGTSVTLGEESKQQYSAFFSKPEVKQWQQVISQRPDYPDAYHIIAILAYNDHNCQLANTYILTASRLDPVDTTIAQSQKIIEACGT